MIQIDMEMPKSCADCPLLYDQMSCSATGVGIDWNNYDKERLSNCPLKEVKESIDGSNN